MRPWLRPFVFTRTARVALTAATIPDTRAGLRHPAARVCCPVLLLLVLPCAAAAQTAEKDILDAVLAQSPGSRSSAEIQSGDPFLDAAVRALDDTLPRPWTVPAMLALFESATTGWNQLQRTREAGNNQMWEGSDEEMALVSYFSTILAASRDPRATLALGRQLESPEANRWNTRIVDGLQRYAVPDPSYQLLPPPNGPIAGNLLPVFADNVQRWWELNRFEVERRAAASPAPGTGACPDCRPDDASARATLARLVDTFRSRQPRIRLSFSGGDPPRFVQVQTVIEPRSGAFGASNSMQRHPADPPEITLRVPGLLIDDRGLSLRGVIMSPGYRTVSINVADTSVEPVIRVAFVPLPTRNVSGVVSFTGGAVPRAFTLSVDMWIAGARGSFAGSGSTLQAITEAAVGADGVFTLVLPDIVEDALLSGPGTEISFRFRPLNAPFVLSPNEVTVARISDGTLALSTAPRPVAPRGTVPGGR